MKSKISDQQIKELMDAGMSCRKIADTLGFKSTGTVSYRMKRIRNQQSLSQERAFDLKPLDTLTKDTVTYRVIDVHEDSFTVRRVNYEWQDGVKIKDVTTISKTDYISGVSGYRKMDLPEVKIYKLDSDPEETKKTQLDYEASKLSELGDDPAYEFDRPAHKESFTLESKFRAELDLYDDARQRIMDRVVDELPLDAKDLNTYSRVVERYGGCL